MYACIDACMHIGLCLFVCLCMYLCMYACVNVCSMRIHACTHICLCGVYDLSNAACHKISVEWDFMAPANRILEVFHCTANDSRQTVKERSVTACASCELISVTSELRHPVSP